MPYGRDFFNNSGKLFFTEKPKPRDAPRTQQRHRPVLRYR